VIIVNGLEKFAVKRDEQSLVEGSAMSGRIPRGGMRGKQGLSSENLAGKGGYLCFFQAGARGLIKKKGKREEFP